MELRTPVVTWLSTIADPPLSAIRLVSIARDVVIEIHGVKLIPHNRTEPYGSRVGHARENDAVAGGRADSRASQLADTPSYASTA